MTRNLKFAAAAAAVTAAAALTLVYTRHDNDPAQSRGRMKAEMVRPQLSEEQIAREVQSAAGGVTSLEVRNVGDIVVLRGTGDADSAGKAAAAVKRLGFARVANLIFHAKTSDDDNIRRDAERHLAQSRSLDGCLLRVSCENGVLRVTGTVHQETQIDAARAILRGVAGAREVKVELNNG